MTEDEFNFKSDVDINQLTKQIGESLAGTIGSDPSKIKCKGSLDDNTGEKRAIVLSENPYATKNKWIPERKLGEIGFEIPYKDLPSKVKNYLDDYNIRTPENRKQREEFRKPRKTFAYSEIERACNESLEHIDKEYSGGPIPAGAEFGYAVLLGNLHTKLLKFQ